MGAMDHVDPSIYWTHWAQRPRHFLPKSTLNYQGSSFPHCHRNDQPGVSADI